VDHGTRLLFDLRFFDEHHGDVISNRVNTFALRALQAGLVMNQLDGGLAQRADEDVQEVLANGHIGQNPIVTNGGSPESLQSLIFMATRTFSGIGAALAFCVLACAHPMGNFSVNRHARFEVRPAGVTLTYVLELAEQPALI
jgi:hypothetical protein